MPTVAEFDDLPAARAAELLRPSCGASRWVAEMVARRPFGTLDELLAGADEVWASLAADDWHAAVAGWNQRMAANPAVALQFNRLYQGGG